MTRTKSIVTIALLAGLAAFHAGAAAQLKIKAVNKLQFARPGQTIELAGKDLSPLGGDLTRIHVKDAAGSESICQAVDTDYNERHRPSLLIFQADFGPGEEKDFTVSSGARHVYTKEDFKAYGRFVRERFDDFAWENDRIAHRMFGKALETWDGEPLIGSGVDVWSKRVSYLVINNWYMAENYHKDTGEGCDDYSSGTTRGCGGTGLWANDRLWVSKNFVDTRQLANGPIRVMFELVYEAYDVNGRNVSEVKRISLDAGSQLDHFQCAYKPYGNNRSLTPAIGLRKMKDEQKEFNAEHGWLAKWEPMEKDMGMQGVAMIAQPASIDRQVEDKQNDLLLLKSGAESSISYWAGFAWDKAGKIATADAWKSYVDQFAQGLLTPIEITIAAE